MVNRLSRNLLRVIMASQTLPDRLRRPFFTHFGGNAGIGCFIAGPIQLDGDASNITIGDRCFINRGCHFDANHEISIGHDVQIGQQCLLITGTHEIGPETRRAGKLLTQPIAIMDGVWLGARVTVLPGAMIGKGSIVAANSVVRGRLLPGGLYGGVPAQLIRMLDVE